MILGPERETLREETRFCRYTIPRKPIGQSHIPGAIQLIASNDRCGHREAKPTLDEGLLERNAMGRDPTLHKDASSTAKASLIWCSRTSRSTSSRIEAAGARATTGGGTCGARTRDVASVPPHSFVAAQRSPRAGEDRRSNSGHASMLATLEHPRKERIRRPRLRGGMTVIPADGIGAGGTLLARAAARNPDLSSEPRLVPTDPASAGERAVGS